MPEAKFQIKRKCEVCGNTFIAKTLDSRYCCRHCTDIAYKKRKAAKAKEERLNQIAQLIPGERVWHHSPRLRRFAPHPLRIPDPRVLPGNSHTSIRFAAGLHKP